MSRSRAILRAAARLGAAKELKQISAQEIASAAGVALRTLYRYYPTKYHVFAAVLSGQIDTMTERSPRSDHPAEGVADLMAGACAAMLERPHLAHAMITATQVVRADGGAPSDHTVRDAILNAAGATDPTPDQVRVARLVEQTTFGILTWTVGGALSVEDAVADIRLASRLLISRAF